MAETPLKRQRDEITQEGEGQIEEDTTKRHKSYNQILSLLEAEEDEPNQDLSSLMSTLEHELSCDYEFDALALTFSENNDPENPTTASASASTASDYGSSSPAVLKDDQKNGDGDKERVMRHLLEASDDELGIPQAEIRSYGGEDEINGGDGDGDVGVLFSTCDALWEIEDEAANYYSTLWQSELFM